ncbi:MAG: hypothetical protein ACETWR_16995 [Anaerolineae bacterium]
MSQPTFDLSDLFGVALQAMTANRQEINALDGHNGNHGDNMVENLRLITDSLQEKSSQTPAEALGYASQRLQSQGHGGTSQYYARGLSQAAEQLQGRSSLDGNDVTSLLQVLLGAIPSQGHQPQPQVGGSVLEQVLGMASGQPPQDGSLGMDDVLNVLLPAGLAFLQAKQSGADTTSAAGQALMSTLTGGQMNPLQAGTPRAAAGGLIAQSILQALATRR